MNISYENKINLAFDKPLEYKGIYLYPATLPYYSIFLNADECLNVSRLEEKDIRLLRLSYLDYLYEKSLRDNVYKGKWDMLIYILNIVLKDQSFEIVKENGHVILKVYQRTNDYDLFNEEYEKLKKDIIQKYNAIRDIENVAIEQDLNKLNDLKEKMFESVILNEADFDEIRQLIMYQNDIKAENYSSKVTAMLEETKRKISQINKSKDDLSMEDLITAVAYSARIKPEDMYNMTIRRFNRYLYITRNKDDFYLYKQLELSGNIELKSELPYWIKHF